jgi:hypothetical protein
MPVFLIVGEIACLQRLRRVHTNRASFLCAVT